jgi:peptidoglycan hydrolase-like protein with peptidoglycan-binding domain
MTKNVIKLIQNQLNTMGFDAGPEDGIFGARTYDALS